MTTTKCCICGASLSPDQVERFALYTAGQNLAACGPEHLKLASEHPDQCYLEAESHGWTQDAA